MPPVTIYHNPDCGTSRNTLALLRHADVELRVVEYLKTPPSRDALRSLIERAGLSVRDVVRKKGTPYGELGLAGKDDGALLDAMMAHPILINRPIVESDKGVALCRPSDIVLDLLPRLPAADLVKEEGVPFLYDEKMPGSNPALVKALKAEDLPVGDVEEPNRTFFVYRTLGGVVVGFAGYELYGADVFLRSIVVAPEARSKGIGRNLLPLLLYRAFRQGAREAWLLTMHAAGYFEKTGFKRRARDEAPPAILETRQAKSLCPSGAILMSKEIGF
jgi:arsenate reductase